MVLMNSRNGRGAGLNCATASSMANSSVRIKMRTRTSHVSQLRSSNVDSMAISEKELRGFQGSRFQGFTVSRFQGFKVSKLRGSLLETLNPCPLETWIYPASFEIIENSGM